VTSLDSPSLSKFAEEFASSTAMEEVGDSKAHIAAILTCYYELQDFLASHSGDEDVTMKAETLGEAIHTVPWTVDFFQDLFALHKQDIPHVLEAIQMVRQLSQQIFQSTYFLIPPSIWTIPHLPIHSAEVPYTLSSRSLTRAVSYLVPYMLKT
jgi:hypothetical protein